MFSFAKSLVAPTAICQSNLFFKHNHLLVREVLSCVCNKNHFSKATKGTYEFRSDAAFVALLTRLPKNLCNILGFVYVHMWVSLLHHNLQKPEHIRMCGVSLLYIARSDSNLLFDTIFVMAIIFLIVYSLTKLLCRDMHNVSKR